MTPNARHKPIVTWRQLALLLSACAVGVWLLLPDDPRLLEDLVRDGKIREARQLLEKMSPAERQRDAARLRLIELKLARHELKPGDAVALERYWRQAVATWRELNYAEEVLLEFSPVIALLPDTASAWAQLRTDLPALPPALRQRLGDRFVQTALGANQPATAASIYADTHSAATRAPEDGLELARLWTLAGRPAEALDALGNHSSPEHDARRVSLLRQLNRNREALALLRAQAVAQPGHAPGAELANQIADVALAAAAPAEAAPILRAYLERHPEDVTLQRRLREIHLAAANPAAALPAARAAVDLGGRQRADLRVLAQILEYAGEPQAAFDTWLELALQGDFHAADRLVALNPGLYRDDDLRRALEHVVPVPDHPEYTLQLARLESLIGRYDYARKLFEDYLATQPDAVEAMRELATLHTELYRYAAAEIWLRRAGALRPEDTDLRRALAENLVLQHRPDAALALYAELAGRTPDQETLGAYIRIAESLGRYDDFTRGLRLRIQHFPGTRARDYRLLAYGYELAHDPARRLAALEEARERGAGDEALLALALAYVAAKNYRAAQAVMQEHTGLRTQPTAAALYLEILRLNNDTAAERRFLAEPLVPALADDEAVLTRVAAAREALRDYAEAERLRRALLALRPADPERIAALARVLLVSNQTAAARRLLEPLLASATPEVLRLAVEVAVAAGDYRAAETAQLAFLDKNPRAGATEWGALGDIRLSRGDREGAKRAYAEALRRMHARLRTAAP